MGMKKLVMVSSTALFVTLIALMAARETDGEGINNIVYYIILFFS